MAPRNEVIALRSKCRGQISPGNLQIYGGLLFGLIVGMEKPDGRGALARAQAFLLAGHVIVNVVPSAFLTTVESESFVS